ncbi:hypothetical protein BDW59DRAFT_151550 [Aspergillus cavernicola]|uniref:Azaphilone pigments biosynthesis cluster protein L N-terminal domain-containing protein n=1 Tax=Aspergillus cavernicola TaxID=176166 RepID=A0ABR4HX06_9EURO
MEDPPIRDCELSTLSIFALDASIALHSTVESFKLQPMPARDLSSELQALIEALGQLSDTISAAADVDLSALGFPLLQCGTACNKFEQLIKKCLPYSDDGSLNRQGWTSLTYIGGNINDFRELLYGYKLTFHVALAGAHLRRQSSLTIESLEAHKDLIKIAKASLALHLDTFGKQIELILDADVSGLQQLKEQQLSMEKCLEICIQLSDCIDTIEIKQNEDDLTPRTHDPTAHPNKHRNKNISTITNHSTGDAVLFMVSTDGNVINGSNRALGWRARHLGGHLSDASVRQISRDFTSINIRYTGNKTPDTQGDASFTAHEENPSQPRLEFEKRYGQGSIVPPEPTPAESATPPT